MDRKHGDSIPLTSQEKPGVNISITSPSSPPPAPSIRSLRSQRSQVPLHHFWKHPTTSNVLALLFEILLAVIPCIFIVLAIAALTVDGQPYQSGNSSRVYEAARVAPTIFPIIFAAVAGRLMRNFALWRAERGERLGFIEQLHGSQNLVAALERAYLLPGLGLISVLVVVLWMLSPLGGQSSSRVLRPDGIADVTTATADVYYFNSSANALASGLSGSMDSAAASYFMNGILAASLLSILQTKGQDLWGNVKVPFLESALAYNKDKLTNAWYNLVDYDNSVHGKAGSQHNTSYTAMTGIVTGNFVPNVLSNFTMQSTYYNLTCERPVILNDSDAFAKWAGPLFQHTNVSEFFGVIDYSNLHYGRSFLVDTNYGIDDATSLVNGTPADALEIPFNIIYASRWVGLEVTAFNCNVGYTHVELDIMNDALGSHVRGIRQTTTPEIYTDFLPFWVGNGFQGLFNWIEAVIPNTLPGQVSPVDRYVSGSDTPFTTDTMSITYDPNIDTSVFPTTDSNIIAQRLASLLNTGWQSSFLTSSLTQSPSTNQTLWAAATDPNFYGDSTNLGFNAIHTTAATEIQTRINSANMIWIVITIIDSCILLACGITSLIIKYRTFSPDVLGFVSSMTRDNPNFERVPGSEQLDGLEYAKKLSNVRIQLDVAGGGWNEQGGDEHSHITLRNLGHAR